MTISEIMFSVTGLEFAFTQAPTSMKALMQACWLLTVTFGNIIVVIIAEAKFFKSQANEFFLFAGLMIIVMLIFVYLATKYRYVIARKSSNDNNELNTVDSGSSSQPAGTELPKTTFANSAYQQD